MVFTTFAAPLAKVLAMVAVLLGVQLDRSANQLRALFAWVEHLRPWSMIEVYLLAVFVAYVRLGALAHIELGPALYALAALMLTMVAADATLDVEAVWEALDRRRSETVAAGAAGLAAGHAASAGLRHLQFRHPHRAGVAPARDAAFRCARASRTASRAPGRWGSPR